MKRDGKVDRVLGGSGREVRRRDGEAWPEQRTAARLGLLCSVLREGKMNGEAKAKLAS